jgi:hypothetical protein
LTPTKQNQYNITNQNNQHNQPEGGAVFCVDVLTFRTKKGRHHLIVVMGEDFPWPTVRYDVYSGEATLHLPRKVAEDEKLLREVVEKAESFLARREAQTP